MYAMFRSVVSIQIFIVVFGLLLVGFNLECSNGQIIENNPFIFGLWRLSRAIVWNTIGDSGSQTNRLRSRLQRPFPKNVSFPCDVSVGRSQVRPTSVHKLKAGDIDVVAGLGDSLMCNNGAAASNEFQVLRENRGLSWAAGGQGTWREFTTFPNIIKVYNPALQGYAINDGFTVHNTSKLNLGEPGALSIDMLYSAQVLLRRMQEDPNIDVKKHWKVISIMIGANDLCSHVCYEKNPESYPELHRQNLIRALQYIKKNIPRSFVNIVPVPPINILSGFRHQPPTCWAWHLVECSCFFGSRIEKQQPRYVNILKKWVAVEDEVSRMPQFQDQEDFAVVYQPFTTNIEIPKGPNGLEDLSYLSVDCFHLSQKANALAGVALFHNMFQPIGQKDTNWKEYYDNFPCPSKADPYIKTHLNSRT